MEDKDQTIARLRRECDDWKAQRNAAIQTREAVKAERDDLEAEVRSMQRRLSAQTREIRELQGAIREARRDHRNAMGQVGDDYRKLVDALTALLQAIADRGDGYCTPEAEQAARKALECV